MSSPGTPINSACAYAYVPRSSFSKSFKRSKPFQSGAVQQHTRFEDSEPEDEVRAVNRKQKRDKKHTTGACLNFGMLSRGNDSDDSDDAAHEEQLRGAFQRSSASSFPYGAGGRAAGGFMVLASSTYVPHLTQ